MLGMLALEGLGMTLVTGATLFRTGAGLLQQWVTHPKVAKFQTTNVPDTFSLTYPSLFCKEKDYESAD